MLFNSFYDPYPYSSYPGYARGYQDPESWGHQRERAEILAAQRARRAQYLPEEDPDTGEEYLFGRQRIYPDARRQEALENERYQHQLEELRRREAARLRQAAELERNRRGQARPFFGRNPIPTNLHTPLYTQSSQGLNHTPHSAASHEQNFTPQQTPKTNPPNTATPPTKYTEVHHGAAQRIQRLYRQQRSLRSTNHIASLFEETRNSFTLPAAIDFMNPTTPSTSSADENVITLNSTFATEKAGASSSLDLDADHDVVVTGSDAASPRIETDPQDGSPDNLSQSSDATPSADDPVDIKVLDEEPFIFIIPEQSVSTSDSPIDNQVEIATHDNESLGAISQTQTTEAALGDWTEVVADDHGVESNRAARLAYTKQNYPLHAYLEKLNVLLMKLDGVESFGSQEVRERRKEVARNIEKEAERVEALVKDIWMRNTQ